MPTIEDFFPSRFLKPALLDGEEPTVTIAEVGQDNFRDDDGTMRPKPILYFKEKVKPLILNKTNFTRIAEVAGDDIGDWHGTKLVLFVDKVNMHGKNVDTIRVRPAPKVKTKAEPEPAEAEISEAEFAAMHEGAPEF